ncbi:MAG TPA: TonB-dependent hemoglobin/transferrin/lactoferrin family receptor [Candidatus Binatia bacterium]|nr:TonB-dependent hemoglobin/transferrin/lactoferrin family receptor [Candidatus Binatia bacterium]
MRRLWGTTALAAIMGMAGAAQAQDAQQVAESETVTVTATRTEAETFEVPATVTVITEEAIDENLVADIKDLVRFEPGVSVRTNPARYSAANGTGRDGNSSFNIRGLEGNRVLMAIDGVRVPDGFSFGPLQFGRGDYVDLDLLSRVEIVRGPASALYGSDGVAGVVSFITRDPRGFLDEGETFAARLRATYDSADDSWAENVIVAGALNDQWSGMLAYTRRDGHEQENQGTTGGEGAGRTAPNPQETESNAATARLVFEPNDAHRFRLTADYGDSSVITEVLTARGPASFPFPAVFDFDARDTSERSRLAFDHTFGNEGGLVDRANWSAYYQSAEIVEFHFEDRSTTDRTRIGTFENEVAGVAGQLESEFATGAVEHHVIVGGDYSVTRQEGIRDGTFPSGEVFPTRPFPVTDFTLVGVFIQDEISLLNGSLQLFPAVRYDSFEIDATDDALYTLDVVDQEDSRITPRFGIVAWPTDHFGAFFNYAQGFRAPSPTQVNQAFTNATQFYTSIPNPNLRPETSETFEVGIRIRDVEVFGADVRASATAFTGDYEDFIEQVQVGGPPFGAGSPGNLTQFQVINFGEVTITGYEGRIDGSWDNGLGFIAAASYAEGEQTEAGVTSPLESVDPWRLVAGLSWDDQSGRFGGQAIVTYSSRKEDDETNNAFRPDAFTILDLTAYWNVTDAATLRVGAFNVTDETYWWWSDVRDLGLTPTSPSLLAFTQPGRNFSASISYRF